MVKQVTSSQFKQEVLDSEQPVLVDFWAEWCGPCRMVAPVLEELSGEMEGQLKVVKVNVDEESSLAGEYGIMSIPTMMLFKDGESVATMVGFSPKQELIEKLKPHL